MFLRIEEDDNGEPCITFPEEVLLELGWKAGDQIVLDVVDFPPGQGTDNHLIIYKDED